MEVLDSGAKRTGALLIDARTAAGLELVDIARETRVPLRHLRALETDRHDELPALPYAIGFVKAYARAVGLDVEAAAAQFRSETTKSAHIPTSLSLEPLDERRLPSRTMVVASVGVVALIIAGLSAWGSGAFDPAPDAAQTVAADPPAPATSTPTPMPTAAGVDVGSATGAGPPAPTADPFGPPVPATGAAIPAAGAVVLTAREDVWVKIYDRTTRANVKVGILKMGEAFPVPAAPEGLMLRTGKAGALAVTIAGQTIPPLGGPVETISDVSLTAADLAARATGGPAAGGPQPIATIPTPAPQMPSAAPQMPSAAPQMPSAAPTTLPGT